ncbi:hypothetical protein ABZP36_024829 [Zizania latifolia]
MEPIFPHSILLTITRSRPQEDFAFMAATGDIDAKVIKLTNHALVAWEMGLPDDSVKVTKFHPEYFLVTLASTSVRDATVEAGHITVNGRVYAFRAWDVKLHVSPNALPYHVRLCLEGLPMHAWKDHIVVQVVGQSCSVHFIEEYSRQTNYTRTLDLWVWCQHPDAIPKIVWLTITNPDAAQAPTNIPLTNVEPYDASVLSLKLAHSYKVLLHVDKIDSFSFGSKAGHPVSQSFDWVYGMLDGEVPRNNFVHNPDTCGFLKPPVTVTAMEIMMETTSGLGTHHLTSVFKQPLSLSTIKAIKDSVMIGGGNKILKQQKSSASSSTQSASAT